MAIHEGSEDRTSEIPSKLKEQGISFDDCATDNEIQQHFESNPISISIDIGYVTAPLSLQCNISKLEDEAAFTKIRLKDAHKELCPLCVQDTTKLIMRSNILEYRFKRLPFSIIASPSLPSVSRLGFSCTDGTESSAEISANLYAGNILVQAQTEREILQNYKESKSFFSKIGTVLRHYVSNSNIVNMVIPKNNQTPCGETKLFGAHYDTKNDRLRVKKKFKMKVTLTKRDIVSQIDSVFSVVVSLLIGLKFSVREIFIKHPRRDDRAFTELHKEWKKVCAIISNADRTIFRDLSTTNRLLEDACLWAFADTSKEAKCSYAVLQEKKTYLLVTGKTKMSPKKAPRTIPKLELLELLIALRLGSSILLGNNYLIIAIVSDSGARKKHAGGEAGPLWSLLQTSSFKDKDCCVQ
uniref:RT_RNaseH domain-containing protein n=1 Tax=Haemonchus contortus TaxID=6289 RepID=A0A7I4XVF8_HAECO